MKRHSDIGVIVMAILLSFVASACDSGLPCSYDGVRIKAEFGVRTVSTVKDTAISSVVVYAVTSDSLVEIEDALTSDYTGVTLPLSNVCDTSNFVFRFDSIRADTLKFVYTKELLLETHECGFVFFYDLTDMESTCNVVDSLSLRNPNIDYVTTENVKIYF